jgi:hypothetical protein
MDPGTSLPGRKHRDSVGPVIADCVVSAVTDPRCLLLADSLPPITSFVQRPPLPGDVTADVA